MKLIESAPAKTSPLDILPTSIMKAFKEELAVMITDVANSSFRTVTFPQSMRKGQVTPLLKKPGLDTTDFKNFRPITNLTTISKIIERLALQRLGPYLGSSPNYCRLQSAYFISRSTETALVKIVDDILGHSDGGSVVALVVSTSRRLRHGRSQPVAGKAQRRVRRNRCSQRMDCIITPIAKFFSTHRTIVIQHLFI